MNKITSTDVSDWLHEQLSKAHQANEYAAITVTLNGYKGYGIREEYSIYHGPDHQSGNCKSIEECFAKLADETPQTIADMLLEQAAELTARANKILTKAQP
jgi:hypothetical protein